MRVRNLLKSIGFLVLLSSLASAEVIDRTHEERPLIVRGHLDMSEDTLIDNNASRPAVIVMDGGSFKLGKAVRTPSGIQTRSQDPGLGLTFDGKFLPALEIGFSHHDFARAFVAALGSVSIECDDMLADVCVSITANPDGTYGTDSKISVRDMHDFRFGVLASGQTNLLVEIETATAALWPQSDEGPGHAFYANESRNSAKREFLRLLGCKVRIGKSTASPMVPGIRGDHVTAKFKGAWNVDYECLDDQNPCGALDQYGSSGRANVQWKHPGGNAQNSIFLAFRSGNEGGFGPPNGKWIVSGRFDARNAPDLSVPRYRWETKEAKFVDCTVLGGAEASEWEGVDKSGVRNFDGGLMDFFVRTWSLHG